MEFKGKILSDSLSLGNRLKVGTRFTYSWAINPLTTWTDVTPNTTVTTDGVKTSFVGGNNTQNNALALSFYIGVSEWTITQRITIKEKSATSFGFAIGVISPTTGAPGCLAHFLLDSARGYIAYTTAASMPDSTSLNNQNTPAFVWNVNDVIDIKLRRRNRELTITMTNTSSTTPMVSELVVPSVDIAVGVPRLVFYGGQWDFTGSYLITYDGIKRPSIGFIGDSVTSGSGAKVTVEPAFRWADLVASGVKGGTQVMAGGFETTADGLLRVDDLVNWIQPKDVLTIGYGLNDRNIINNPTTFEANYRSIIASVLGGSNPPTHIVLCKIIPNDTNDVTSYNTIIQTIATDNGLQVVDFFTLLKNPANTTLSTLYKGDYDTLHPNRLGHNVLGNAVKTKLIQNGWIELDNPQVFDSVPLSQRPVTYLGLNSDNQLVSIYDGASDKLIKNRLSSNTMSDAQDANIFVAGAVTAGGQVTFTGLGNLANPAFKLDILTGIITTAANLNLSNVLTIAGGSATVLQNWLLFKNSSYIRSVGPLKVAIVNPGTGDGFVIDNDTTSVGAGYRPFVVKNTTVAGPTTVDIASIDKDGKAQFNSVISSGVAGSSIGGIKLSGNVSGTITIQPATTAGTYTLTLPTDDGNTGQVLTTDGSGVLNWSTVSGTGSVTNVIFTDGSGFDGTVTSSTTTPTISLAVQSALNGNILYSSAGALTGVTIGAGLSFSTGTLSSTEHGTVTSINLTQPAAGITVSGGPITASGSITLALANDLSAVEGLSATGLAVRTATDTWSVRTITGVTNQVNVSNGDGVSGNPALSLPQDIHTGATPRFAGLGIGTAANSAYAVTIGGSGYTQGALNFSASVSATVGSSASIVTVGSTIVEAASGNHPLLAGINLSSVIVTTGVATVTDTAMLYIGNSMTATVAGKNYSIFSDAGENRFDGIFNAGGTSLTANQIWGGASSGTAMEGKTLTAGNATTITHSTGTVTIGSVFNPTVQTLTDGATITWNVTNGGNAKVILGATGRTLSITNPVAGYTYTIEVVQDATGSRTITTWPSGTTWVSGTPPTLSTAANSVDIVVFYYNGSAYRATFNGPFA